MSRWKQYAQDFLPASDGHEGGDLECGREQEHAYKLQEGDTDPFTIFLEYVIQEFKKQGLYDRLDRQSVREIAASMWADMFDAQRQLYVDAAKQYDLEARKRKTEQKPEVPPFTNKLEKEKKVKGREQGGKKVEEEKEEKNVDDRKKETKVDEREGVKKRRLKRKKSSIGESPSCPAPRKSRRKVKGTRSQSSVSSNRCSTPSANGVSAHGNKNTTTRQKNRKYKVRSHRQKGKVIGSQSKSSKRRCGTRSTNRVLVNGKNQRKYKQKNRTCEIRALRKKANVTRNQSKARSIRNTTRSPNRVSLYDNKQRKYKQKNRTCKIRALCKKGTATRNQSKATSIKHKTRSPNRVSLYGKRNRPCSQKKRIKVRALQSKSKMTRNQSKGRTGRCTTRYTNRMSVCVKKSRKRQQKTTGDKGRGQGKRERGVDRRWNLAKRCKSKKGSARLVKYAAKKWKAAANRGRKKRNNKRCISRPTKRCHYNPAIPGTSCYCNASGVPGSSNYCNAPGVPGSSWHCNGSGVPGSSWHCNGSGVPGSSWHCNGTGVPGSCCYCNGSGIPGCPCYCNGSGSVDGYGPRSPRRNG